MFNYKIYLEKVTKGTVLAVLFIVFSLILLGSNGVHNVNGQTGLPELVFSAYAGGTLGESGITQFHARIAKRENGEYCIGMSTFSNDFSILIYDKPGFSDHNSGGSDVIILCYNPDNTYKNHTYLGGTGQEEFVDLKFDSTGNIIVAANTQSDDYPIRPAQGSLFTLNQGPDWDIVITKLSPDLRDIDFSVPLGGGADDLSTALAVDENDFIYFAGKSRSNVSGSQPSPPEFPMVNNWQSYRGKGDAIFGKLASDGRDLIFTSFYGGPEPDQINAIAVAPNGNIVMTGHTLSDQIPTPNGIQTSSKLLQDAFLLEVDQNGQGIFGTLLAGDGFDEGKSVDVDTENNVYVAVSTGSTPNSFPSEVIKTQNALGPDLRGPKSGLIVKLVNNAAGQREVEYATYDDHDAESEITSIDVPSPNIIYFTGYTHDKSLFPRLFGEPTVQNIPGGQTERDAFFGILNIEEPPMDQLEFLSYIAGTSDDGATDLFVDERSGVATITGLTFSIDLMRSNIQTQPNLAGQTDGFIFIVDPKFQIGGRGLAVTKNLVGPYIAGQTGEFEITVKNNSSSDVNGPITFTDETDGGMAFVDDNSTDWDCSGSSEVTCTHQGTLAPGEESSVNLRFNLSTNACKDSKNKVSLDPPHRSVFSIGLTVEGGSKEESCGSPPPPPPCDVATNPYCKPLEHTECEMIFSLLKSHEDLLRRQADGINHLGKNISSSTEHDLLVLYAGLLTNQNELLKQFNASVDIFVTSGKCSNQ